MITVAQKQKAVHTVLDHLSSIVLPASTAASSDTTFALIPHAVSGLVMSVTGPLLSTVRIAVGTVPRFVGKMVTEGLDQEYARPCGSKGLLSYV